MRKSIVRITTAVMAATMLFSAVSITTFARGKRWNYTVPTASITEQDALATAYADAGVNAADATLLKNRLEYDDGYLKYDIDFYAGGYKYEYEVDATSGAVLEREAKYSKKYGSTTTPTQPTQPVQPTQPATPATTLSAQDALNVALQDAGFTEADVRVKQNKLKTKRWGSYYDVEFYAGWWEYEYEIDATSGAILEKDIDD